MSQPDEAESVPTIAGLVPVTDVMSRQLVTARPEASVDQVVALLREKHVGCVPIVDDLGRPIGIVTKLDVVECMAEGRPTARDLMMPLALSVGTDATVVQAAAIMSREVVHHVLVVDEGRTLVGVISTMDIARWLARNDGFENASR